MPCWNFSHEGMKVSKINWNYACKLFGTLSASTFVSCPVLCKNICFSEFYINLAFSPLGPCFSCSGFL